MPRGKCCCRNNDLRGTQPRCHAPGPDIIGGTQTSGLVHAVFDIEPAVVAGQSLGFDLFAASREPGLILIPLRAHLLQAFNGQFHLRHLRFRRRSCSLRRCCGKRARDKQHGGKTHTGAKHGVPPGLIHWVDSEASVTGHVAYPPPVPPGLLRCYLKIAAALCSVIQTPQASGMPTKAQNNAALASRPPLPMPNEPACTPAALFALAACSFATSSALIFHFGSTGLIR